MRVAITGTTGFIGQALGRSLARGGHEARAISLRRDLPPDALQGCDAVVHLAGEPVAQRWTAAAKDRILQSRVEGTRKIVEAMRAHRPQVLVSASGVGYYGDRGDDRLTESEPPAGDYLGKVAAAWEKGALEAEALGVRVARIRIGMVLGPGGGALAKMLLPFKLGLGGPIGSGKHWVSWIHIEDLVAMIEFLLEESTVRGVFNAVSPHPATNAEFTKALAKAVGRPAFLRVPVFALRAVYGEMADVLVSSQRAVPDAITRAGFTFKYPDVYAALAQIAS